MWKRAAHFLWWLGASTYFGGLSTLGAIAAPVIFATTKSAHMSMPGIVSPPLVMDRQVGGEIFGNILNAFRWVEVSALFLMLLGLTPLLFSGHRVRRSTWVLLTLWILLTGLVGYDAGYLTPRVWQVRTEVRNSAAQHLLTAPVAGAATEAAPAATLQSWPEQAEFDALHDRSELIGRCKIYVLLAMILVASWRGIAEKGTTHTESKPLMQEA